MAYIRTRTHAHTHARTHTCLATRRTDNYGALILRNQLTRRQTEGERHGQAASLFGAWRQYFPISNIRAFAINTYA